MFATSIIRIGLLYLFLFNTIVSAAKFNDDELMANILDDSPLDKNVKILHFTESYDPDTLMQNHKDVPVSPSEADTLISDHNKLIFKIQLNEPMSDNQVINQLCKTVAEYLNLPIDSIKVSKYEPGTGDVKMFFLYTLKQDNETDADVMDARPASEILSHINQKRFQNIGRTFKIMNVKNGLESSEYKGERKVNVQSIFSDKNWEAWQLAVIISATMFAIFCIFILILFLSSHRIIKDKVGPVDEPRHVVVQPILRPAVAGVGIIQPENRDRHITETDSEHTSSPSRSPMRIKGKGLLERRGSNASLTLDLNRSQENIHCGTPPKECSTGEYLQSAGKRLTRRQLRSTLRDVKALHTEFWEIPMNHPEKVEVAGSGTKNRYKTILPNESTRVHLYEKNDDPLSSYINANYIRGYGGERNSYIATQGPLPHTVNDFWMMVWKEKCPLIVMITKLKEKMKVKCEPYIPDHHDLYNDIEVTVTRVIPRDGYTIRELILRKENETHTVHHFWYTSWPDHKTPDTAKQLIAMALEVEALRHDSSGATKRPMVVHCSAGIGRTGCFIAASIGIQQLLEENTIDVLGIVCSLRLDRGGMVQTAEQYEFVHQALSIFESTLPGTSGE